MFRFVSKPDWPEWAFWWSCVSTKASIAMLGLAIFEFNISSSFCGHAFLMGKTSPLQRSNQAPCTCQYTQRGCFYSSSSHWGILPENRLFWAFLVSQLVLPACNWEAVWVYPIFPRHILRTTFQLVKFKIKLNTANCQSTWREFWQWRDSSQSQFGWHL